MGLTIVLKRFFKIFRALLFCRAISCKAHFEKRNLKKIIIIITVMIKKHHYCIKLLKGYHSFKLRDCK